MSGRGLARHYDEPQIDGLCRRLELRGRKKSHRLTVASDLRNHICRSSADECFRASSPHMCGGEFNDPKSEDSGRSVVDAAFA
jgi:hypothetical protein